MKEAWKLLAGEGEQTFWSCFPDPIQTPKNDVFLSLSTWNNKKIFNQKWKKTVRLRIRLKQSKHALNIQEYSYILNSRIKNKPKNSKQKCKHNYHKKRQLKVIFWNRTVHYFLSWLKEPFIKWRISHPNPEHTSKMVVDRLRIQEYMKL